MLFTPDTDDHKFVPKAARFLGKALLTWNRKSPPNAGWSAARIFWKYSCKSGLGHPKFVSGRSGISRMPILRAGKSLRSTDPGEAPRFSGGKRRPVRKTWCGRTVSGRGRNRPFDRGI